MRAYGTLSCTIWRNRIAEKDLYNVLLIAILSVERFVPEGQLKIAQHFSAGYWVEEISRPGGTPE